MSPEVVIAFFGGLFAIGGIILAGQWMPHGYLAHGVSQEQLARLTEGLQDLREELEVLRGGSPV